jgi:WD40 repeat protein
MPPPFPLASRVLEVIADRGETRNPRYRFGSGCLVAGRTVLTAAHVVADAASIVVRGPDKILYRAVADPSFIGDSDGPGPDLALIEVIDSAVDVPRMSVAVVVRDSTAGEPVERCHVIGYPVFMERQASDGTRFRETADALGRVPVLSGLAKGLLSVQVSSSPEMLPPVQVTLGDSPWSGMSGAPVVADGFLIGVVTEHALRAGASAITATPLTALEADQTHPGWGPGVTDPRSWWTRLGVGDPTNLKKLPTVTGRGTSTYWATVQEIRQRTGVLTGRQDELAAIGAFVGGTAGYRWLVGKAWAGKTSLLAEAILALPTDTDVICYFLSRREADADSSRFLTTVVPQLAGLLDENPAAAGLQDFRDLWRRANDRAETEDRHLLLIVDGLDEDLRPPGLPSVAALLPAATGNRGHVLVSSRPHPELPADVPAGHPLRGVQPVPVQPFAGSQELEVLARQEIDNLLRRDDDGLAADVLGLLTAAAGPLAVRDLTTMTIAAPQTAALTRRIRGLLTESAARSLQHVGLGDRYQFAHESLLAYAQGDDDLNHSDFRHRIHRWAEEWRAAGWPTPAGGEKGTPQYLLDSYPSTLTHDRQRLAELVCDIGWVVAAIASAGVDHLLADLRRAYAAIPADVAVAAILTAVTGQAHSLRLPQPLDQPGYILRQLWMQSAELGEDELADNIRSRLHLLSGPCLMPQWTTRRASRALSGELGRRRRTIWSVAALGDEQVVSGGADGRVLIWNPADPGAGPIELGRHLGTVWSVAVLGDGRVVSGGEDGRMLVWDPVHPGSDAVELGQNTGAVVSLAALGDGRVVSGGTDGRVLIWNPADPGAGPIELGRHLGTVWSVAVLGDRRVVSGGTDGRVLIWNPADPSADSTELGHHEDAGHNERVVRSVAVLGDGRVVSGGADGRMLVWDQADPECHIELGRNIGTVGSMAALDDGRLVSSGTDSRVLVWDSAGPGAESVELGRHERVVRSVAVLGDGRVVSGGADGRVLIWNPADPSADLVELARHERVVRSVAMLGDGRVVSGGADGRVLIWNPADPNADPAELGRHRKAVRSLSALGHEQLVAGDEDGRILVWNPADPSADPAELGRHRRTVRSLAALSDGRVVSGADDGRILLWNPADPSADPAELGRHLGRVWSVAALADGRVVSGGTLGRVLVWDPHRPGAAPTELGHQGSAVQAVAALPDGRVVTGGDQRVLVWDPDTPGAAPTELGRHNGAVRSVSTLRDGTVITGGTDQRMLVWDTARADGQLSQVSCSVAALATAPLDAIWSNVVIAHVGSGFSFWSFRR